jgi:hypothetical protein
MVKAKSKSKFKPVEITFEPRDTPKPKKLGRLELISEAVRKQHSHLNSKIITDKQDLLIFEQSQVDTSILNLTAALAAKKERRTQITAILTGLGEVLACR